VCPGTHPDCSQSISYYHEENRVSHPYPATPEVLPSELRDRPQWICWRHATLDGRPTKEPVSAWDTGRRCNDKDPAKWASWDHAYGIAKAHPHLAGIGYAFAESDPYTGLDYDDCRNPQTGEVHPAVLAELKELSPCYAEISPSETGIKAIVRGKKPGSNCRTGKTPWGGGFEIYDKERYFTTTGWSLEGFERIDESSQEAVQAIYARRFPATEPMKHPTPIAPKRGILSDAEIVHKAAREKRGPKFRRLFNDGDPSGFKSRSEASFSLLRILCFYARGDEEQMARLFRQSALWTSERERKKGSSYPDQEAKRMAASYTGRFYDRGAAAKESREMIEAGMVAPLFTEEWKGMAGGTDHNTFTGLLISATESGTPTEDGVRTKPGYEDLAALVGTSKPTVIASLRRLEERGLIRLEAKHRPRARCGIVLLGRPRVLTTYVHGGGVGPIRGKDLREMRDLLRLRWGQSQFATTTRVGKTAGLLLPQLFVYRDGCSADSLAERLQRRADKVVCHLQRLEGRGLVIERDGLWYLPDDFWRRFYEELEAEGITAAERIQHERHERHREAAREWSARETADEREIDAVLNEMCKDREDGGFDPSETAPDLGENSSPSLTLVYGGELVDMETGEVIGERVADVTEVLPDAEEVDVGDASEPGVGALSDDSVQLARDALSQPESRAARALAVYRGASEGAVSELDHVASAVVLQLGASPASWREWIAPVTAAVVELVGHRLEL
jgi:putative DNA primase/helicase